MGRFLPVLVSLIGAFHVVGVFGQESAASCIGRCTNTIRNQFADLKCSDANAAPCFCKNPTFPTAILECSKSCGATMDMISGYLTGGFCDKQGLAKPAESAASSAPASPSSASSTPQPTSSAVPTTSSAAAAQSTSTTAIPSSSSASQAATTSSSTELAISTSATDATTVSPTTTSSPSTTSDTAASATSSAGVGAGGSSNSDGLSQAAIAGIGIGIGAAVIAVAGIVICMLLKGRKGKKGRNPDNMEISKPLPGSGRMYANREDNYRGRRDASFEKYGGRDVEMTANRYEDMVPRTQPRTMV